jgi:hypothetical protein
MELPEYVSLQEVQRVCKALNLRDWTVLSDGRVTADEAQVILTEVNVAGMDIELEQFRRGLEVELEHGTMYADANVTNNHPILTGKIVLAHLKEMLDYYARLEVAEIEGDMLKAAAAGDVTKLAAKYAKLIAAKRELADIEGEGLS